ncbi:molybdenum cofactor biosynthesis protein B [Marinobacterium nitratireducens]|uniref:Molybdenum cofactor biosynthesis protein B n=1 Tax=Marinobacterium nitratireducens TaxID=518897 RepID=A0A918DNE1_9GAMM|nr:molybdenum cofactor biosynthesis protein B [Marinobacterium nitratireducens]GGO76579.1 molybdenum cofactor biosynthesis protein B [Marinobacterium nitratireducens]
MGHVHDKVPFRALDIAVLTVSDTRSLETDSSGDTLQLRLQEAGHRLADRALVPDDIYQLRARVSHWIADPGVQVVLVTGGTGFTARDNTPEALAPLFDKAIEGYGELFRAISYQEIGTSTMQSRAIAGVANRTVIFCMPGSPRACATAWDRCIVEQLDARHRPCNFVEMVLPKAETACGSRS